MSNPDISAAIIEFFISLLKNSKIDLSEIGKNIKKIDPNSQLKIAEILNKMQIMIESPTITEEYQNKVGDLIHEIINALFEEKRDLKTFCDAIVKKGAAIIGAKTCVIFLLEESENSNGEVGGQWLRLYSVAKRATAKTKTMGETLEENNARYYVPYRPVFTNEGDGKNTVNEFLHSHFKNKKNYKDEWFEEMRAQGRELIDVLKEEEELCLMKVLEDDQYNYNIIDLIEKKNCQWE